MTDAEHDTPGPIEEAADRILAGLREVTPGLEAPHLLRPYLVAEIRRALHAELRARREFQPARFVASGEPVALVFVSSPLPDGRWRVDCQSCKRSLTFFTRGSLESWERGHNCHALLERGVR